MASKKSHSRRRQCPNCYYPLPHFGEFCSHCGQKYTYGKLTVGSLIREFLAGILNLENRIWQTLLSLFVPGKLTKAFFKGRQKRYVSPLRLFFVTAISFFAIVSYWGDEYAETVVGEFVRENNRDAYFASFLKEVQTQSDSLKLELAHLPPTPIVLDSLYGRMHASYEDSVEMSVKLNLFDDETAFESDTIESFLVAKKDLVDLSTDSIVDLYAGNQDYLDRLIFRQNIRFQVDAVSFVGYLISKLIWMMLVMMPLLALVLKLLYIRHSYYYVEHLIFSFHIHAFLFVILSLLFLLTGVVEPIHLSEATRTFLRFDLLVTLASIAIPIYLFLALLRVYRQSKTKTFFKFLILLFFYSILFLFASVLTFAITALIF